MESSFFFKWIVTQIISFDLVLSGYLYWNTTRLSSLEFQLSVCPRRCNGSVYVPGNETMECFTCQRCHCERPACEIYGICCPDISVPVYRLDETIEMMSTILDNIESAETNQTMSSDFGLENNLDSNSKLGCYGFYFVRQCLPNYKENQTIVNLCQEELPQKYQTQDIYIQIDNAVGDIFYKNIYCALCNNVHQSELHKINLEINLPFFYNNESAQLIHRKLMQYTKEAKSLPNIDFKMVKCFNENIFRNTLIIEMPDLYKYMQPELVKACLGLNHGQFLIRFATPFGEGDVYYDNIFCSIVLNGYPPSIVEDCERMIYPINLPLFFFSALLNFNASPKSSKGIKEEKESDVKMIDWLLRNGQFYKIRCAQGKEFKKDNCIGDGKFQCKRYLADFGLTINTDTNLGIKHIKKEVFLKNILSQLASRLESISNNSVQYSIRVDLMMEFLNLQLRPLFIVVKMNMQIEANLLMTEFEQIFLSEVVQTSLIFRISNDGSITLNPFFIFNSLKNVERTADMNSSSVKDPRNPVMIYSLTETRNSTESVSTCDKIFYLNKLLLCKYIRLDKSVYQVFIDDTVVPPFIAIKIDFNITKIRITDNEDLIMVNVDEDGYLDVCIALLDRKWKQLKENDTRVERPEADHCEETPCLIENILTFVCLIMSMVCLLLTLLAYSMFPVLRTKAGVNNMFLSFSLLLAQVSLISSTFTSVGSILCIILGALTHFLWLWNFSWNFICSFCMFRVFAAGLATHYQPNMNYDILKPLSGSFVLPVSVVSAVITYSYFTSQEREFGYGNVQCYLDLPFFIGIAVAAPLFIITLINISLFLVVAYKIYSVRRLQSTSFRSSAPDFDMTIYMKLSTVTGMFWIVAVLAEFSDNEIFGLVALVLNGLQGVSIFLSFVCNKRVVALCSALLRQHQS